MSETNEKGSPFAGPLHIDEIALPGGGVLGLTHCPGRNGVDGRARRWRRGLPADLGAIDRWGATTLLTLLEEREFATLGVPGFAEAVRGHRFDWRHVPIPDMRPPQAEALEAWRISGPAVMGALRRGERVLIHCAAGLGRSGTLAAKLLVEFGVSPQEAIARVRSARPGTIETPEQEAFVLDTGALRLPRGA